MFFKKLNRSEAKEYKQWAREKYKPFSTIEGIWHPVVQLECVKINTENTKVEEKTNE